MHIPYDRELGVHQQSQGFTRLQEWDFENTPPEAYPLLLQLPVLRPVPQAGGQAGRPGAGDVLARRRVHPGGEGAQLRLLRARTVRDSSLSACIQAVHGRRGGLSRAGPRLPGRGRADGPARPAPEHPRRRARRVAGRLVDRAGGRASAACATTTVSCRSRRGCRAGSTGWSSRCSGAGMRLRVDVTAARGDLLAAQRWRIGPARAAATTARRSRSPAMKPVTLPIPTGIRPVRHRSSRPAGRRPGGPRWPATRPTIRSEAAPTSRRTGPSASSAQSIDTCTWLVWSLDGSPLRSCTTSSRSPGTRSAGTRSRTGCRAGRRCGPGTPSGCCRTSCHVRRCARAAKPLGLQRPVAGAALGMLERPAVAVADDEPVEAEPSGSP